MKNKITFRLFLFLLMISFQYSFAQEKKLISGVVTSNGLPISGVDIVIIGTEEGTNTDQNGYYSIYASSNDVLEFSYVGLNTITRTVGATIIINVSLTEDESLLDELIILGYGQKKNKNEITGNVTTISGDDIKKIPVVSIDQALQGKVAGLLIQGSSGTPGSTQTIRIRGMNSISGSNAPLIVIDGVPVTNSNLSGDPSSSSSLSSLSAINSSDVESMTVLKDAAATSVYGARGSNGVILITTKRGKSGQTSYEFSASSGFQNNAVHGPQPLSGEKKLEYLLEAYNNTYNGGGSFDSNQVYQQLITDNPGTTASLQNWIAEGRPDNDWYKLLQNKNAPITIINFSATGGDEISNFYASLGYNKTEGTIIGSDFRRVSGMFTYDRQLSKKIDFGININISNIKQEGLLEQGAYYSNPNMVKYFMSPWNSPYNPDGSINIDRTRLSGIHNPLYTTPNNIKTNDIIRALTNVKIAYKFTDDFKFTTQMSTDYNFGSYRNFANPIHGDGFSVNGYAENSTNQLFKYNSQNSLDYKFFIADIHKFDVKILMEYEKSKNNYLYAIGENIPEGFDMLANASKNFLGNSNYQDESSLAYLGLLNYAFDNKYLVDLSFRREASSKFHPDIRWGTFWSVGGAWNIMNEDFMYDNKLFSLLRLRASYGTTGNSGIRVNSYQNTLVTDRYDGNTAYLPSQLGDKITWETVTKTDVGVNFGFLKDKVTASFAYYNSISKDLLLNVPITKISGYSSIIQNTGDLRNRGIEFDFSAQIINKESFTLTVFGNIGTINNKVLTMPLKPDGEKMTIESASTRIEEGHPIRGWYMRKYAGVNPDNGDALWYVDGEGGETTNIYNDAKVTWQGGSALPTYVGGFGTQIDFKGFFLGANMAFSGGNKIYEDWGNYIQGTTNAALLTFNSTDYIDDRWQNPGDITNVPKLTFDSNNNHQTSTRFLKDGGYMRLREISFGYNFKPALLEHLKISSLSLSIRGTNLYTWTKDKSLKLDPEVGASAGDGSYGYTGLVSPPVKSVIFSINVKF